MTVSRDLNPPIHISEETLAIFLESNEVDALTDILVQSLEDALRILRDEINGETIH